MSRKNKHWTLELCKIEAKKYQTRNEFQKYSENIYQVSRYHKWLDEICSHMILKRNHNGSWTFENIQKEALKYNTRTEFSKKSSTAYSYALKNKWIDKICSHMIEIKKRNGYWTKERCYDKALKYKNRRKFQEKSSSAYKKALENNWLDEICYHMIEIQKPANYWTKEQCHKEALKYNNKTEFMNKNGGVYKASYKNGWLDENCSHMERLGNLYNRCIYAFEFPDNYVYIGLTFNIKQRKNDHLVKKKSMVYKHIQETNLQPELKQLTNYIDRDLACTKEGEYVKQYKQNGWNILNKAKTGGIGGNKLIWSFEKCKEEALKYNTRTEFQKKSGSAYESTKRHKWLDEICSHMISPQKPKKYWTFDRCKIEASKYNTRGEYQKKSNTSYKISLKNKWLNKICKHMILCRFSEDYWTKERCNEISLKYNTRTEFQNKDSGIYKISLKNKWLNDICSHMIEINKPSGYWTKEKCAELALKYNTRWDFGKNNGSAYVISRKNRWLDEICSHMKKKYLFFI